MALYTHNVTFDIRSGCLWRVGSGDGDISTKDGRKTRVYLAAKNIDWICWVGDKVGVKLYTEYTVAELAGDKTCLQWWDWHSVEVPLHMFKNSRSRPSDVPAYERTWELSGKQHSEKPIPEIAGTVIQSGTYCIDGGGDDYTNARVQMKLVVPIKYEA